MAYTISQIARESNVNIETVRYYEKRGLISKVARNESGYRIYTQDDVKDIQFIKRAQEIGFTLEEIREVLYLYKHDNERHASDMYQFALAKIQQIDQKIGQLQNFKSLLESVTDRPPSSLPLSKSQCPVIQKCTEGE
ncbi:heavy metal-responsive transcriptional regulator [Cohnella cholangitidis]|uniref:Heavy metal-responsive transcriptional regulator n=1 Tax=Cohnella cholangitidis TaxID=2598458 RepID=A0A7G5C5Q8_9BACL|nr:heavy metal-responsive transcriptional regulator [Cohnella cholangitidis]QMV44542.1 heavy metal-responsive transcriptional regulator [Cohnella cholangitidis]